MPEDAMIDWARVAELQDEVGKADFGEVLALFLEEVEEVAQTLRSPAPGDDVAGTLHFMRGSALNMGLTALARVCGDAEAAVRSGGGPDPGAVLTCYAASRRALLAGLGMGPATAQDQTRTPESVGSSVMSRNT